MSRTTPSSRRLHHRAGDDQPDRARGRADGHPAERSAGDARPCPRRRGRRRPDQRHLHGRYDGGRLRHRDPDGLDRRGQRQHPAQRRQRSERQVRRPRAAVLHRRRAPSTRIGCPSMSRRPPTPRLPCRAATLGSSTVPPTVSVPSGSSSALFGVATVAPSPSVTVTATLGSSQATDSASVSPTSPNPAVYRPALAPDSVTAGNSSTGTVTLDCEAPAGGAVVDVSSSLAGVTVPLTVDGPAGSAQRHVPGHHRRHGERRRDDHRQPRLQPADRRPARQRPRHLAAGGRHGQGPLRRRAATPPRRPGCASR